MSDAAPVEGDVFARTRSVVVVAVAAALVALFLGGQGLLVPAGPTTTVLRVTGALVSLAGVGVLLRLDGPATGTRTLAVVAVAGACTGLATLPLSPVTLSDTDFTDGRPEPPDVAEDADDPGTVVLDGSGPDGAPGGGAAALTVPPGAEVVLDGDDVVLRLPDGSSVVIGRATPGDGVTSVAPVDGERPGIVITGGTVTRTDGGPVGGGTPLGGVALEGGATRVVVGDGVLLDVPDPLDAQPLTPDEPMAGLDALFAALLACFALLAFAPPVVRLAERTAGPVAAPEPTPRPEPSTSESVEEGLADVLRSMLADPDPRTAVIGAYARMLVALEEVGFPRRAEEAPHEHLWRTLGPLGVRRAPLHRLAELFVRARFTPRPVTEAHRQAAIAALADAVADLRLTARDVDEVAGAVGTPA